VCELTGCRAYHRVTGNQIAKIYLTKPQAYANTEVVFCFVKQNFTVIMCHT